MQTHQTEVEVPSATRPGQLVFAYGSNMLPARLRERVREVRLVGIGVATRFRFAMNKLGRDGSAKANLVARSRLAIIPSAWGVLYELQPEQIDLLDRYECGYSKRQIQIQTLNHCRIHATAYVAPRKNTTGVAIGGSRPPFSWYRRAILDGAAEVGLPVSYRAWLRFGPLLSHRRPRDGEPATRRSDRTFIATP